MVEIPKIEVIKPNFAKVEIKGITFWYSYKTLIAVKKGRELLISENEWSTTTGKHLNLIDADKKKRIPHSELLKKVKEL